MHIGLFFCYSIKRNDIISLRIINRRSACTSSSRVFIFPIMNPWTNSASTICFPRAKCSPNSHIWLAKFLFDIKITSPISWNWMVDYTCSVSWVMEEVCWQKSLLPLSEIKMRGKKWKKCLHDMPHHFIDWWRLFSLVLLHILAPPTYVSHARMTMQFSFYWRQRRRPLVQPSFCRRTDKKNMACLIGSDLSWPCCFAHTHLSQCVSCDHSAGVRKEIWLRRD